MNSLNGKSILVTGATGFVGSRLAARLVADEKANVTGTGRNPKRISHLKKLDVSVTDTDLMDTEALKRAVDGQDFIFHTAAVLSADPQAAKAINVDATGNIVRLAGEAGVKRVIHVSTVGVYDMAGLPVVDESTPLASNHPSVYPRTKAQAELLAAVSAEKSGVELTIVRPSMIYGPGHGIWTVGMFDNIMNGKPVFLGDGSANFNPVYIDDVVDALILCAKSPDAAGESFNISAEVTTWRGFMRYYGDICNKKPKGLPIAMARLLAFANKIPGISTPIDQGFIEMATSRKFFPVNKAFDHLGWKPKVNLEEGMRRTTRWIKDEIYTD
jgi:2-alkyl-3-oxoalkanoate reductase